MARVDRRRDCVEAIRIPLNASTNPEFTDSEIKFDLAAHAEGIGMTGWDWNARKSRWVAFDFDSIVGHSEKHSSKLTEAELQTVRDAASALPFVTVRKSTSGKGLHLYVHLGVPVHTDNHTEHAALARAILGKMAALTCFDFQSHVDACGGNMWVWHRKMQGTDGLTLVKQGEPLTDIPGNWKDHITVTSAKRRKTKPSFLEDKSDEAVDLFEELCGQYNKAPLDSEHQKLIQFLKNNNESWWWDQDHHMLVAHTLALERAHKALSMRGVFSTTSSGSSDINCFLFPMRKGSWVVRRYNPGVAESAVWDQDGRGYTRTYLNREADIKTASRAHAGLEHPSGGHVFDTAEDAIKAAQIVGVHFDLPPKIMQRRTKIKEHRDGRIIVEIEHDGKDDGGKMQGWLHDKNAWKRIFSVPVSTPTEPETGNYDDVVRHLVTEAGDDYGWGIKSSEQWLTEPFTHVKTALESLGLNPSETKTVLGQSIFRCWTLVNKPFQPEYPGDRQWNRDAVQFRYQPTQGKAELNYPSWKKVLVHIGSGLDSAIKDSGWCRANGIENGEDYLRCWIASMIKEPLEPLPYLFLYGPQNSGKSILYESLSKLFTGSGVQRADVALISQQGFNAELEKAVLCVVEETDLRKNKQAYERIKDWVTSRLLPIHRKGQTPYMIPNTTHWIQSANDPNACPIFTGDSRITMICVPALDPMDMVPKKQLLAEIEKEAADFLASIMQVELPPSNDRLNVPVITTDEKLNLAQNNQSPLEAFIAEECHHAPGQTIKLSTFFDRFMVWLDPSAAQNYSKRQLGRELMPPYVKGRLLTDGSQFHVGNISFEPYKGEGRVRYVVRRDILELVQNDNP